MELPNRIATVLAPHLGENTAESVAYHLCAKHEIGNGPVEPSRSERLHDTLRRGLVAFVGVEEAQRLADLCLGVQAAQS